MEVKNVFNHFKWTWLNIHKMIQNNELSISQSIAEVVVGFLHVVKYTQKNLFDLCHLYRCGQADQGMQKIIPNIESAICQD